MVVLLKSFGPEVERNLQVGRQWRSLLDPLDIMQATYVEAFLRRHTLDPNRSDSFFSWLCHIAENNLKDAIRGLERQKRPHPKNRVHVGMNGYGDSELLAILGETSTTPSRHASRAEQAERLDLILQTLPEDYSTVVRLYDLERLPIDQVVSRMKRSPGAIHMLRARAHDRLRELLGSESSWFSSSS